MITGEELKKVRLKYLPSQGLPLETEMTCDTCPHNDSCESAFDRYNTNGDCLESK